MAALDEIAKVSNHLDDQIVDQEEKNLWTKILSQVQSSTVNKLPANKNIILLGDPESGKTTLTAKLQGNEDPKKGTGLEYFYVNVRDEYRDDHTRLGVWILDGDAFHKNLLKFALSEKSFKHSVILLVATMTQPWSLMESLDSWASTLQEHINRLKLSNEELQQCKQNFVRKFQTYVEPTDEIESGGVSPLKRTAGAFPPSGSSINNSVSASTPGDTDDALLLPIGQTTLTNNLGVEIVVVITKTDYMSTLEKEHDYKDEHFDFIQQHVRKFCLTYGASLIYTSVKDGKNCDLLYKYLVHRIYGLPFNTPALVVEKDAVFIPSGWDNEKKINILHENLTTIKPDDNYTDVIVKPIIRKPIQREAEIQSEDEQLFLMRQQALYNQQTPSTMKQDSMVRSPAGVQKTSDRRMSSPGQGNISSPKKLDGTKGVAGTNEGVLANFFNSLLNKKTGAPTTSISSGVKASDKSVRSDAVAELDRMTRPKKPMVPSRSEEQNNASS